MVEDVVYEVNSKAWSICRAMTLTIRGENFIGKKMSTKVTQFQFKERKMDILKHKEKTKKMATNPNNFVAALFVRPHKQCLEFRQSIHSSVNVC